MTEQEQARYRYLTVWADYTPAEALAAIHPRESADFHRPEAWRSGADESLEYPMEHSKNRRAA